MLTIPYNFNPRDYQRPLKKFIEKGGKRAVAIWHRRAGKDKTALNIMIEMMLERVGVYYYFLPTYNQARKIIWDGIDGDGFKFINHFPRELLDGDPNQTEMKIRLKNGSLFQLIGTDKYDCYDDKTEILTNNGWKLFKDLTDNEIVATLKDGNLVYEKINKRIRYDYRGDMYQVKSKSIDLLTTPNHKYFVKSRKGVYKFRQIKDISAHNDRIPTTCKWEGLDLKHFQLPEIPRKPHDNSKYKKQVFEMKDWCSFMGIYLSEGSTYKSKKDYKVYISQDSIAHPKIVKEIRDLLNRMDLGFYYDGRNFLMDNKQLYEYLKHFGKSYEKYIPRDLLGLSPKYLNVLKDWMVKGDGYKQKSGQELYYSTSKKLIDDFQELVIKIGLSGNIHIKKQGIGNIDGRKIYSKHTMYSFCIRRSEYKYFRNTKGTYISKKRYNGKIYCVDVPNHIIKVRRNGFEVWCGNSIRGTNPVGNVFSEYSFQNPVVWDIIRPILMQNKGWAIFNYCVNKNTMIFTENGLEKIDGDYSNEFTDISENIYGLGGFHKAEQYYRGGIRDTIKITTSNGYNIECTPNHKLWDGTKWIVSSKYNKGDYIAIQRGQNIFGKGINVKEWKRPDKRKSRNDIPSDFSVDKDFSYLLGLILAEGNWDKNKCVITNFDRDIIDFIGKYGFKDYKNGHYIRSSQEFCSLLSWLGFKNGAKNKDIPSRILGLNEECLSAFISGYFDGDGFSQKNKSRVGCTSASEELIKQMQILLLNYGITSRKIKHITKPTKIVNKECVCYNLNIEGYNAYLFYKRIGFRLKRKQDNIKYLKGKRTKYYNENVILNKKYLDNYIKGMNETSIKRQNKITYYTLKRLLKKKNDDKLKNVLDDNFYYDKIISIENSKCEVRDFVIPNTHSFFSNGFISHNTPNGHNHGYELYQMAKDNKDWFSELLTIEDTGVISKEEVEQERKEGMDEDLLQQEYYVSFEGAMHGSYYSKYINEARNEERITNVPLDLRNKVHTCWDLGIGDATAIWFFQQVGMDIRLIDYYETSGEGLPYYIKVLQDKGYIYGNHYAPFDIENKEFGSGKTRKEIALGLGVHFQVVPRLPIEEGIDSVRRILKRCWFDKKKCKQGLDALSEYHKEYDEKRKEFKQHPFHNYTSHSADAFRYLALSVKEGQVGIHSQDEEQMIQEHEGFDRTNPFPEIG